MSKFTCIEDYPMYKDTLSENPDIIENLVLDSTSRTNEFIKVFNATYNTKRLCTDDISLFKEYITNTFNQHKEYYIQKLNVYERELNGDLGESISRTLIDNTTNATSNNVGITGSQTNNNTEILYDIPRSQTKGNPTNQTDKVDSLSNNQSTTGSSSGNTNKSVSESITGNVNVIKQRELWLKFIKNIYLDFADKFKDCFLQIYL